MKFTFLSAGFAALLLCGSWSPALADDLPNLSPLGSYEVPASGEHVVLDAAFISPEGHLVLQADDLDDGALQANFYDTKTSAWLLPASLTDKNKVILQQRAMVEAGSIALPHMPTAVLADGAKAYNMIHLRDICFRPYADFLTVKPTGQEAIARAIYIKRSAPAAIASADDPAAPPGPLAGTHSCASADGGHPALTAGYRQESAFFVPDNGGGFFALVGRYAIHFDALGHTDFFKGHDNPVFLSAEDSAKMQAMLAAADKSPAPQSAIDQADALIGAAAHMQMQDVK